VKLSTASNYTIRALVALASRQGNPSVASHDLAEAEGLPDRFLLKLLGPLVRTGILHSLKGPNGGYRLARPASAISLLDIIEAVDGPLRGEAPGFEGGDGLSGKLKAVCQQATDQARKLLSKVSVADLAGGTRRR
jgi:Rrf2 family protein